MLWTLLSNFFSSTTSLWTKAKAILLAAALGIMLWQGYQMLSLQADVARLETTQTSLQQQVKQVEENYEVLRNAYKQSAQTSEQYIGSVQDLSDKSVTLEKSFFELERKTNRASENASKALSMQGVITPRGGNENRTTELSGALTPSVSASADGDDAEWRRLLDHTFCEVQPQHERCTQ